MRKGSLLAMLALFTGCASMRVHSQVAPQADLGHYQTFSWLPPSGKGPETILDQQVRAVLRAELTQDGLREAPAGAADFLVDYHVLQEHNIGVTDWGNGIYGWDPEVVAYTDGSFIVDFIDPRTNRVFWRASATSVVEHPGIVNVSRLEKAASQLMHRYPHRAPGA